MRACGKIIDSRLNAELFLRKACAKAIEILAFHLQEFFFHQILRPTNLDEVHSRLDRRKVPSDHPSAFKSLKQNFSNCLLYVQCSCDVLESGCYQTAPTYDPLSYVASEEG